MNGSRRYNENRCESVAGCGYAVNGDRYKTSLITIRTAMTSDWATSMPLMPASMLMLLDEKMESKAMYT